MDVQFGLRSLDQVHVPVDDLPRAIDFYRDVLGMVFLFEVPSMAFFSLGDVRLMLGERLDGAPDNASILYYGVEEIQSATEELTNRGVTFELDPTLIAEMPDHDLWMSFFRDSEGNQLALMSEVPRDP
jgi:methylmalonyl-CoA/ethylmalonyl-CoA epimerase